MYANVRATDAEINRRQTEISTSAARAQLAHQARRRPYPRRRIRQRMRQIWRLA